MTKNTKKSKLIPPICAGCEKYHIHLDKIAAVKNGVRLQPFERYCFGGKKPRLLRGKDANVKIPCWCPRRKDPCELRVYGFKSENEKLLHDQLCMSMGKEISPMPYRYTIRHEQTIGFSAYDFWRLCGTEPENELLPVQIELHEVLEIDDGIKPRFFYKTKSGFQILWVFKQTETEKA